VSVGAGGPAPTGSQPSVVATAGHVDHGKSALVLALTGIDPDRWAEEKRRGLTIDLGFAWTSLPSGREVGFVDVPGHERFVRNMLAGVGPVRLVLFVVAADEGWKPQSEEHLQILDVLGVQGAVVALTKVDLQDATTVEGRTAEIRARLRETRLADAPIVPVSARTGAGLDALRVALDGMLAQAPAPASDERPRLFVDRVFTIRGAGTVVTGTLTGGPLETGRDAEILPVGRRARIRGLQTHARALPTASPVSRVAVNLAGTDRAGAERGDVLTLPGQWRATSVFEGWIRPVRGLTHPVTARGAYKAYAGSAERDARIRVYGTGVLGAGERGFVRVTLSRPAVLDAGDGFVLRDAGRRETVAGGTVVEPFPPARSGRDPAGRLGQRLGADRTALAMRFVADRGAVPEGELLMATGVGRDAALERGAVGLAAWIADPAFLEASGDALTGHLERHHAEHPLQPGLEVVEARRFLRELGGALDDPRLADALIERLVAAGAIARAGTLVRLAGHATRTWGVPDADRLVAAVAGAEPTPPTLRELREAGFGTELIGAVCADGRLVRAGPDLLVTPSLLHRAETIVREAAGRPGGLTVSAFREALGTSRKYALPILEHFDRTGLTRRSGDVRVLRGDAATR
jgi:selenocysteine-specific elongation factor